MGNKVIVITLLFSAAASAMTAASEGEKSCISVTVDGSHTLPYDCLSQQLTPPALRENTNVNNTLNTLSARKARQPANTLGLYNHSATAVRMGSNFGHSAQAQRPVSPQIRSPLLSGR